MKIIKHRCETCGKKTHDFEKEEALYCIPPRDVLKFGQCQIDKRYRDTLYKRFPFYTSEEIIGSYLDRNPNFPSQDNWLNDER